MRLVLAMVFAGLVALPLSVSAQAGEEGATVEPSAEEPAPSSEPAPEDPAPSSEPAPEEPALQLKLDEAGVGVVPPPSRTPDGYTLEEMELRVKRAKIGLGVSAGVFLAGAVMGGIALGQVTPIVEICFVDCPPPPPEWVAPVGWTSVALITGGLVGFIASGVLKRRRERDRDMLQEAHYETPRRVQWDLARSRLVF